MIRAVTGAVIVNYAKSQLSESFPDFWTYFLGALFVGSVLVFPQGIIGLLPALKTFRSKAAGSLSGGQQQQLALARVLV